MDHSVSIYWVSLQGRYKMLGHEDLAFDLDHFILFQKLIASEIQDVKFILILNSFCHYLNSIQYNLIQLTMLSITIRKKDQRLS